MLSKLKYFTFAILSTLFVFGTAQAASVLYPYQGGTGTPTVPTYGQVLVGNSGGTYTLTATSSLGITGSGISTPVSIANGGTATSTGGVTNGVEYFNGTNLTNNANFLTNSAGTPNTLSAAGYQQNGQTILANYGTGSNSSVAVGVLAGNSLTSSVPYDVMIGYQAGQSITSGSEAICIGDLACATTAGLGHVVSIGTGCMWHETGSGGNFDTCIGGDSMRQSVGTNNDTAIGNNNQTTYFGFGATSLGSAALDGNSSSLLFSGTPANGEVLTFTFTDPTLAGSPLAITYTISGTPSLSTLSGLLVTYFQNAGITGVPALLASNILPQNSAFIPNVLWFNHQGNSAIGDTLSITMTSTGTTAATITGGVSASSNNLIAIGSSAMIGGRITTANNDIGIGQGAFANLTSATNDDALGNQSGEFLTSGVRDSFFGDNSGVNVTTCNDDTAIGYNDLQAADTGCQNTAVGSQSNVNNTGGNNNSTFGYHSGINISTAGAAVGFGANSLGGSNAITATFATAIGYQSGFNITSASNSTFVGANTFFGSSTVPLTGQFNTAIGASAGQNIYGSANKMTIIGANVGSSVCAQSSQSILIGFANNVDCPTANASNILNIGNLLYSSNLTTGSTFTGRLGIATSTPLSTLTVGGNASIGADYNVAAPTNGLIVEGNVGIGTANPYASLHVGALVGFSVPTTYTNGSNGQNGVFVSSTQANSPFLTTGDIGVITGGTSVSAGGSQLRFLTQPLGAGAVPATRMLIDLNGNVGIGTTTPVATLDVEIASSTAGTAQTTPWSQLIAQTIAGTWYKIATYDYYGHFITSGPAPSVTGGTSSVSGNDRNGTITVTGTLLTSVTLTFAKPYAAAPECTASDNTTASVVDISSISTTQVVFGLSAGLNSGVIYYICQAHQ